MFDDVPISFVPYSKDNLHLAKGYNGFISPDGYFYKVIERNKLETAHDNYVQMFSSEILKVDLMKIYQELKKTNHKIRNSNISYKDMFINILGFVNYEYFGSKLEIGCPNPEFNNKNITDKQVEMLKNLIKLNNDKEDSIYQIFIYDKKANEHETFMLREK